MLDSVLLSTVGFILKLDCGLGGGLGVGLGGGFGVGFSLISKEIKKLIFEKN